MKPFKTIEEQIEILQDRKLIITDKDSTKKILLRSNYYDVINGYGKFFQIPRSDNYYNKTQFEAVYSVYMFDKELQSQFYRAITKIEVVMRSYVSHVFSQYHQDSEAYLDASNFSQDSKTLKQVRKMIEECKELIRFLKQKQKSTISHYNSKYGSVPLWVLINEFDFGLLNNFFNCMSYIEREEISKHINKFLEDDYGNDYRFNDAQIKSFLTNIKEIRNIVAHDGLLLTHRCIKNLKRNNVLFSEYEITGATDTLYNVIVVMKCFLEKKEYEDFCESVKSLIKKLQYDLDNYSGYIKEDVIMQRMGFPENWLDS